MMKMCNFINIGERARIGVTNIFNDWEVEGRVAPMTEK